MRARGCVGSSAAAEGAGDPDNDGARAQAKDGHINVAVTDEVDPAKNDKADWRVFHLTGRSGFATVVLHWDEPSANLDVDLYDEMGANIAASPQRGPAPAKKLLASIDQPGTYYLKISSQGGASVYTFMFKWAGGEARGAAAAPSFGQVPPPAVPSGGGSGPPAPSAAAEDPTHPRARIVQSYRDDDGQLVLYLDKGSGANIKAGATGLILEGADGDKPLDGGDFRITKVVDATHSVAKGHLATVGKNRRCVINLAP
jgi:hypothetical protein